VWEHPESADRQVERGDVTVVDGALDFGGQFRESLLVGFAEEFQCHVCLLGVCQPKAARIGQQFLYLSDLASEAVQVHTDKQSHTDGLVT